ncbi:hypothetical protein F5146DRAFT_1046808 [Armillaria mellea]|nr:hypothetical protein F5146DRAFT_1046808 [Armillaria mellea]
MYLIALGQERTGGRSTSLIVVPGNELATMPSTISAVTSPAYVPATTVGFLPKPMTPAQPHLGEKASQQGVVVEYSAQFSGPPHTGTWSVACIGIGVLLLCFLIVLYCFYYCV